MKEKIETQPKILMIDSNLDFSDYQSFLSSSKVITLDYFSHNELSNRNIPHEISDDFLNIDELKNLENHIYELINWYSIDEISKIITDDGINLGELFYTEFRTELTQFLKNYLEIYNFFQEKTNCSFLVSDNISKIISKFSNHFHIIKSTKKNEQFFSTVDVPIKLGKKHYTIKLNQKNASKLKNIFDKFSNGFLNNKINNNFKTILITDFTTLKTENFLMSSKNFDLNIIKYDRRIPSIWNKKTFEIIKKSKCIIENESTLLNNELKDKLNEKKYDFEKKLNSILLKESILSNHFSINGESFWDALKPLFITLCKKYFFEAAQGIVQGKELFKKYSFSKILLFNEASMTEQIIISLSKQHKIPTFQIQHGLYFDSLEMVPENKFSRLIPQKSDFFITWGKFFKKYLVNNLIHPDQIINLGSLFFDKLSFENTYANTSEQILLASDPLAFNRPIDLSINQKNIYSNTIEEICKIISQNNKKLFIKTHPQKNQYEKEIAEKIDPSIQVFYSGDIHPLIKSSDLIITTDLSTVILEAMILQKPVISIRLKGHYGKPEIFNYCDQIPLKSLDSWIKSFYQNSEIKTNLIAKGNEFLKKYLENQGNASQELLKFLQQN